MKKHSKKLISLIALFAMLCIGYPTVSFGAPAHNVKYTKHNFGTTQTLGGFKALAGAGGGFETQICIFCHTPHNSAAGKKFLWNRNNDQNTFQMYTSSPTLNFTGKPSAPSEVSKMCMSCHDGVTAINAMANPKGIIMTGYADQIGDIYMDPQLGFNTPPCEESFCVNIGGGILDSPGDEFGDNTYDLTPASGGQLLDDHPISFIYDAALASADGTLNSPGGSSIGGLPLWWANGGYRVECVTCHDPHINYVDGTPGGNSAYKPFLRKTMNSSSLCFTCHNK